MADSGRQEKRDGQAKGGKAKQGKKRSRGGRPGRRCDEHNLIAALNHKLRRKALRRLNRSEEPLSPTNLAAMMGVSIGSLSYHVGILRKCSAVELVDERKVRGAVEHFYVSCVADNQAVQALLDETEDSDEAGA